MKRFAITGVLAGLAALAWIAPPTSSTEDGPEIGSPAPEIEFRTVFNHIGQEPNLAALRGQAVLLEFWATW